MQHDPDLREQAQTLAMQLRQWQPGTALEPIEQGVRELGHQVGVRAESWQEQQALLLELFALLLGPSNFFAWGLSVMFLVFTLRAILYKPFVRQIRTTRPMQELQ